MHKRTSAVLSAVAVAGLLLLPCHLSEPHSTLTEGSPAFLCRVEPSRTVAGFEIIAYPDPLRPSHTTGGFQIPCPKADDV